MYLEIWQLVLAALSIFFLAARVGVRLNNKYCLQDQVIELMRLADIMDDIAIEAVDPGIDPERHFKDMFRDNGSLRTSPPESYTDFAKGYAYAFGWEAKTNRSRARTMAAGAFIASGVKIKMPEERDYFDTYAGGAAWTVFDTMPES